MTTNGKRRHFTIAERQAMVEQVTSGERSIREVCRKHKLSQHQIHAWVGKNQLRGAEVGKPKVGKLVMGPVADGIMGLPPQLVDAIVARWIEQRLEQ